MKKQAKRFLSVFLAMMMLLSAIPVVSGFAAGDSMYDATSVSIGSTYYGNITDYNEKDYYKITVNSSGRLTFNATAKMYRIYYNIYNADGESLWNADPYWNNTTEMSVLNTYLDLTKGTYYLVVSKVGGNTGNYFFKFSFADAGESFAETGWGTNNSMSSANTVSLNKTYNGQLAKNDERDFYKFVLPSSGRLTFTATAKIYRIYYDICNAEGESLWNADPYWNNTTEMSALNTYLDLTKGTYYLVVSRIGGNTGNCFFKFSFADAGESFAETGWGTNNSMGSANTVSLNKTYNGQLAKNDEKDFYKFVLPSSGKLTFTATAKMYRIYYNIYNADGESLWSADPYWNNTTEKSNVSTSVDLKKGTYYLVVSRIGGNTGNYSFKLSTHTHKYVDVVTKATMSQDGAIIRRCSCGLIKSSATIPKISSVRLSKTALTYNGKTQRPSVTVKDSNGNKLKEGTDYTVKYSSGCKNVGQYTVTITFKGRYSGTKTLTFKIVPKGTSISKLTAGKKQFTAKWSKQTAQTTGYELQYSTKSSMSGAKTVTVGKNKTTSSTVKKLKSGKKYYVRVRTYKTVKINGKSVKLYSSWSKVKNVKTK